MESTTHLARRRLDAKLQGFPRSLHSVPPRGWIAAIRNALGMSARELGHRLGVTAQKVSALERNERTGGIRLASLERAARAMNCRLVYVLVPNEPLTQIVHDQARRKAIQRVAGVRHSMLLEAQDVTDEVANEQIEDLAGEFADRRGLWSE